MKAVIMLLMCFLTGCAGTVSSTSFYLLSPMSKPPAKATLTAVPALEISDIALPQYLDRPQIVFRSSENRMQIAEFHQWGGNLRKDIGRTVARNLSVLLHSPNITSLPQVPMATPQFRIEVEILQFERDAGRRVVLDARWRVSDLRQEPPLLTTVGDTWRSAPLPPAKDFDATVAAMSDLLATLCGQIADHIQQRMAIR